MTLLDSLTHYLEEELGQDEDVAKFHAKKIAQLVNKYLDDPVEEWPTSGESEEI